MRVVNRETDVSDWHSDLRNRIEEIARRNSDHKNYAQVEDRSKEMDDIVLKLRELVNSNPAEAAKLHTRAISILDETDRLVIATMPDKKIIAPMIVKNIDAALNANLRRKNGIIPEKTTTTMRFATFADESIDVKKAGVPETISSTTNTSTSRAHNGTLTSDRNRCMKKLKSPSGSESAQKGCDKDDLRELWKTQVMFFLSLVGFMVGVGNTIKFPSLVYQYGGGAFLIPYFICVILFGLPIVFLHLSIGQYSGESASGAFWKLMPIASGIGCALVFLALPVSIYYNVIVAWSIYYFWFSFKGFFTGGQPWNNCSPDWPKNIQCCLLNGPSDCFLQPHAISSPEAYFHYEVLNRTAKIYPLDEIMSNLTALNSSVLMDFSNYERVIDPSLGAVQCHLVLALAFAWILVFFGVFKGIGSIGWAITITSTLPYLLLGILLFRGMSLPGASEGIVFLFKPDMERLWSISIWKAAAEQVFYSLGIDAGPLISMASFSRYRNNIYRDAIAVVLINIFTSIFCGMVIFSFIGFLSQSQHRPIDAILRRDPLYIAFAVYPGVTTFMDSMGPLWAAAFFAMLTLSAVDAQFAWIEMIVSSLMNKFDQVNRRTEIRLVVGLCLFCFICGLPLTTRGGIFIFHSIENLNANWNSFSLSFLQIIVIYIYGVKNFIADVGEMLRKPVSLLDLCKSQNMSRKQLTVWEKCKFFFGPTGSYIRWTWCFFSPCILLFLLAASVFNYQRITLEDYKLPIYYELIGWFATVGPLSLVPLMALSSLRKARINHKPLRSVFDTSRWRHKTCNGDDDEPRYAESNDHDYWTVTDPVSRVASTRRPNASVIDDVGYSSVVEMINEWTKKNVATFGDGFLSNNNNQFISDKDQLSEQKNRQLFNRSNSHEITLFGAPPSVKVVTKSNTVTHLPNEKERTLVQVPPRVEITLADEVRAFSANFDDSNQNFSWDNIALDYTRHPRKQRALRRVTSAEDLRVDCHSNDLQTTSSSPQTRPVSLVNNFSTSVLSPYTRRSRQRRHSTDRESISSISITPIDYSRYRSSSTLSNSDRISAIKLPLPIIQRPKPVNAPPPFTQL